MTIKDTPSFLSRENLHRLIWTLIGVAITAICGFAYNKIYGPTKVVLDTSLSSAIPIRVTVKAPDDFNTAADIKALTAAVQKLQKSTTSTPDIDRIKALSDEVKKLGNLVASAEKQPVASPPKQEPKEKLASAEILASIPTRSSDTPVPESKQQMAEPQPLTFNFPPKVNGYTETAIAGVKNASCPPTQTYVGMPIQVGFVLSNSRLLVDASPLFLRVNQRIDPTNLRQALERIVPLVGGPNVITADIKLKPGNYDVSYGYYLRVELNAEYPKFYSHTCHVEVLPTPKV